MQAYNLGHLRNLGLDEEAKRPCFKADSDQGKKKNNNRGGAFQRPVDKLVQRDLLTCFGVWADYKHMEVAPVFLCFLSLCHIIEELHVRRERADVVLAPWTSNVYRKRQTINEPAKQNKTKQNKNAQWCEA